jgi:hypothetical protein
MSKLNVKVLMNEANVTRFVEDIERRLETDTKEVLHGEKIEYVKAVKSLQWVLGRLEVYTNENKRVDDNL